MGRRSRPTRCDAWFAAYLRALPRRLGGVRRRAAGARRARRRTPACTRHRHERRGRAAAREARRDRPDRPLPRLRRLRRGRHAQAGPGDLPARLRAARRRRHPRPRTSATGSTSTRRAPPRPGLLGVWLDRARDGAARRTRSCGSTACTSCRRRWARDPRPHRRAAGPGRGGARPCSKPRRRSCNVIHLPGAARKPDGDVVLCDVAREDASLIVGELRALGIARDGSIALDPVDTSISAAVRARRAGGRRPALRRGRVGARRGGRRRVDRAVVELPRVHGDRDAAGGDRDPARLARAARRRDGRRTRVRADRRDRRRARAAARRARAPLAARAARRLRRRRRAAYVGTEAIVALGLVDGDGPHERGAPVHRLHLQARRALVPRRLPRRDGRDPVADDEQVVAS